MKEFLKKLFWAMPIGKNLKNKISQKRYERILERERRYDEAGLVTISDDQENQAEYIRYVLQSYGRRSDSYTAFEQKPETNSPVTLVAYYLTQFHPNKYNDEWWGKGVTEWNNVNQAVPQFVGHYQPRKPGELGYYDLRIKDTFHRQIELAKNYGIGAFCFYYYWFDGGKRLLDFPLNEFLGDKSLGMPFFYCWANENWTKRFSGTNSDVLMGITPTEDNYKAFISSVLEDFKDGRYYRIDGKPVLSVYRPSLIPEPAKVLKFWREQARNALGTDLYIIAVQERDVNFNWCSYGFDAETEFQPKQIQHDCKNITKDVKPIRSDFAGEVYDYADLVEHQRYLVAQNQQKKVYPAVMPMWDNTARRNFRGTIFHGSTPELYRRWLQDVVQRTSERTDLDDKLVFINAWNEWGEGTYLEPDDYFGYAYLEATINALHADII
ncbi:glycoside hydrolase family 99-like domain-containing protein [Bifidobacterium longum]|nr:glycoside hydrolase family 99-like domain-containing protein [Bifidobacterium longum]MDB6686360.1 glycoside hydrolase family 99-like domain-containing protein [Bifidobacterium longum]MDB6688231.1 glycoside hydrolase family 99-like domain-containing protein [Bifidobacterium longum]MDB6690217.1 glycoside hydrolase family 99-like domain-containing protein [Bifidobacterium longum]MDB6692200.1 glycoside hydrolase family 99-like domain-containing protein [Bifidobacterium longum]